MARPEPDLDRPWSEDECLIELQHQKSRLEDEIAKLKAFGQGKAMKADAFERARARELLRVHVEHPEFKSQEMREAHVIDQTDVWDLKLESEKASTLYDDQKVTVRGRQAIIDALRSMLRSVRDSQESGGYGYSNRRAG